MCFRLDYIDNPKFTEGIVFKLLLYIICYSDLILYTFQDHVSNVKVTASQKVDQSS